MELKKQDLSMVQLLSKIIKYHALNTAHKDMAIIYLSLKLTAHVDLLFSFPLKPQGTTRALRVKIQIILIN